MAYYLASDGTNDYVQLESLVSIIVGQNYRIEVDFECADNDAFGVRLLGVPGSDVNRLIIFDGVSGNIVFTPMGTKSSGLPVDALDRHLWAFYRDNGTTNLASVDGVESPTAISENSTGFSFEWLLTQRTATNARNAVNLYRCKVWIDGVLAHDWNPSNRSLGGNILVDEVGGNHGTLVNFATDGSQWVYYDDGGGEPEPSNYDAGGASAAALSGAGGANLSANAGGMGPFTLSGAGGQVAGLIAGGVTALAIAVAGGVSVAAVAGAASALSLSASGGATVESASPAIVAGGVGSAVFSSVGGAAVTAQAGGLSGATLATAGGAAVSAIAGGAQAYTLSSAGGASLSVVAGAEYVLQLEAAGGAAVNEQAVVIDRRVLSVRAMPARVALGAARVLDSVNIPGVIDFRRVL